MLPVVPSPKSHWYTRSNGLVVSESLLPEASNATMSGARPLRGVTMKSAIGELLITVMSTAVSPKRGPRGLVARKTTVNVPTSLYSCETTAPVAFGEPSPNVQRKVKLSPFGSRESRASKETRSGGRPESGEAVIAGRGFSLICSSSTVIPLLTAVMPVVVKLNWSPFAKGTDAA